MRDDMTTVLGPTGGRHHRKCGRGSPALSMKSADFRPGTTENSLEKEDRCAGWRPRIIESAGEPFSPCGCDCLGQPIGSWQSKQLPIVARNIVYLEFYTRGLEAYTPACFDGDRVGKMRPRGSGVFPFSSSIPGQRKQVQKKCPPAHIRTPRATLACHHRPLTSRRDALHISNCARRGSVCQGSASVQRQSP